MPSAFANGEPPSTARTGEPDLARRRWYTAPPRRAERRATNDGHGRDGESAMKKLIIAVVQNEDADGVVDALLEAEFRATRLASTGGFLRRGNTTLMIGADEDQVDQILGLIRQHARSGTAPVEGADNAPPAAATVFVLDLEEYQRL